MRRSGKEAPVSKQKKTGKEVTQQKQWNDKFIKENERKKPKYPEIETHTHTHREQRGYLDTLISKKEKKMKKERKNIDRKHN